MSSITPKYSEDSLYCIQYGGDPFVVIDDGVVTTCISDAAFRLYCWYAMITKSRAGRGRPVDLEAYAKDLGITIEMAHKSLEELLHFNLVGIEHIVDEESTERLKVTLYR